MKPSNDSPICVAIAVVRHEGRFLVGKRPEGVPLAGFAEFPGGKVLAGEAPAAAAIRECLEESGITAEVIEEYLNTTHRYDHGLLEIHFFHCRPVGPQELPHPPFRWITAEELAALDFPAANAGLTARLLRGSGNCVA